MYDREDIDRVRAATDMVNLVSAYTQLKRSGSRFTGLCPFHSEKTPSFTVNAEECFFHCFGCQESGDCFTFVQKTENLEFGEALESLANRANIQLTRTATKTDTDRKEVLSALLGACEWYHSLLFSPAAREARSYLKSRGYNSEIAKRWKLGWAPSSWDSPDDGLRGALSHSEQILLKAGLLKEAQNDRLRDTQQARIIFPIFDHKGGVIAFGGRALPGQDKAPKYINSPETSVYKKSRVLYGLDKAKSEIVRRDSVIVTEGYTDVIGLHEMGFANTVATCGTALTQEHLENLRRFSTNITLAFDPDTAGQAAAERIHRMESSLGLHIKIANLADHGDPGNISQKFLLLESQMEEHQNTAEIETQLAELRKLFTSTQEYLQFRIDRAVGGDQESINAQTVATPEQRLELALKATQIVSQHPEREIRNQYLQKISLRLDVDEISLRDKLLNFTESKPARSSSHSEPEINPGSREEPTLQKPAKFADWMWNEAKALLLLCRFPEVVPDYVDESLFEHKLHQDICRALLNYDTYDEIAAEAPPEVYREISKLRVLEPPPSWPEPGEEDPESLIVHLLVNKAQHRSREIERQLRRNAQQTQTGSSQSAAQPGSVSLDTDLSQLFQENKNLRLALEDVRQQYFTLKSAEENLLPLLGYDN